MNPLQFGHGFDAVETKPILACIKLQCELQFGHGFDAVETRTAFRSSALRSACFNSATALMPWKLESAHDAHAVAAAASIRPRL